MVAPPQQSGKKVKGKIIFLFVVWKYVYGAGTILVFRPHFLFSRFSTLLLFYKRMNDWRGRNYIILFIPFSCSCAQTDTHIIFHSKFITTKSPIGLMSCCFVHKFYPPQKNRYRIVFILFPLLVTSLEFKMNKKNEMDGNRRVIDVCGRH